MKLFAIKTTFSNEGDVHMHRVLVTPAANAEEALHNFESFQEETISMPGREAIDVAYIKEVDPKDLEQLFDKYFDK
jgi:hypothetical protein